MTALDLFTRLCHLLTRAGIPYQAFEDLSIRLLDPATVPARIMTALTYLHHING